MSTPTRLLQLNADIEPDADNDGFGDETQDGCSISAAIQAPCADLSIIKTSSVSSFTPGQNLTYSLRVRNNGSQPAGSANVVDALPVGARRVSATSPAGPCSGNTTVTCPVGNLGVGASRTIAVVIRPPARASIVNSASVIGSITDPNPANNLTSLTLRDFTRPTLSNVFSSRRIFRRGSALPTLARRRPVGTTIAWTLSEPATTTIRFAQTRRGRRSGRRCVPGRRTGRRCSFLVVKGTLTVSGRAGTNRLRFQGRISSRRRLALGTYTVLVSARDAAGNVSSTRTFRITLVR